MKLKTYEKGYFKITQNNKREHNYSLKLQDISFKLNTENNPTELNLNEHKLDYLDFTISTNSKEHNKNFKLRLKINKNLLSQMDNKLKEFLKYANEKNQFMFENEKMFRNSILFESDFYYTFIYNSLKMTINDIFIILNNIEEINSNPKSLKNTEILYDEYLKLDEKTDYFYQQYNYVIIKYLSENFLQTTFLEYTNLELMDN